MSEQKKIMISLIAAVSEDRIIGVDGDLPWRLPDDMKYFKRTTEGKHVIMGRRNWESIPEKYRPLPGRTNWIVSRNRYYTPTPEGATVVASIHDALNQIERSPSLEHHEIFVIGGGEIYELALPFASKLYITEVKTVLNPLPKPGKTSVDIVLFPEWDKSQWDEVMREPRKKDEKHAYDYDFVIYMHKRSKLD